MVKAIIIISVIAAVLAAVLAFIGAVAKSINTASAYMKALYEYDDRAALHDAKLEHVGRFKWWIHSSKYKLCKGCCIFCEYTQACCNEVSENEARDDMREFLGELREKIQRGEQLTEHESKAYTELELLAAEGKL